MDAAVEIVVTGHHIAGPDRHRSMVIAKLDRLDHLDRDVVRYDVELNHERNPRQAKSAQRVVITRHGAGQALRAEATGVDLSAVLDDAVGKLEGRLRRRHDRRVSHSRSRRTTTETGRA
jgi:ribosomal subunit interface protein